ncbi:MAG TPA: hypothetical protein VGI47_11090 [Candidatus Binataceae bacterium]
MAEAEARPSFFERIQEAGAKLFDSEAAKSAVAAYIDNNEKLAKEFVGFQERISSWAKDTPFATVLEAQRDLATKFIETSATSARKLWRIEAP